MASEQGGTWQVAYLGPAGTYGQQAAQHFAARIDGAVALVPCPSIAAVYAHAAPFCVLPLENTLHGGVTETLDCLLSPLASSSAAGSTASSGKSSMRGADGREPRAQARGAGTLVADAELQIQHVLVARRGTRIEDVTVVRSHEQALGQSAAFLRARLPRATLEPYPSTAGAAASLLAGPVGYSSGADSPARRDKAASPVPSSPSPTHADDHRPPSTPAAICSRAAYELHADALDLLHVGTQGIAHNYTRFVLLCRRPDLAGAVWPDAGRAGQTATTTTFVALRSAGAIPRVLHAGAVVVAVHVRPGVAADDDDAAAAAAHRYPQHVLVELASAGVARPAVVPSDGFILGTYVT